VSEKIPEAIVIDLDGIEIGESFKISSVKLEEGVAPTIMGRDFVIATLAAPTVVKEPEKPAEVEEAAAVDGKDATPASDGDKKEGEEKKAPEEKK
jgi:large subunit ribosomal protein L25